MMRRLPRASMLLTVLAFGLSACRPAPASLADSEATPAPATNVPAAPPTQPADETPVVLASRSLTDGMGRTVEIAAVPQRIVSLAPSNTEILFAIGAGPQLVGRDEFSDYPEAAADLTNVGGPWGVLDSETIVTLEPDLVLAAGINTPEQVQVLEGLGLPVYYLANPMDFEGLFANLRLVGELTGHTAEAESLATALAARVAAVESAAAMAGDPPSVYYEVDATDPNAPWTTGSGTFQDVLIETAGGVNVFEDLEGWAQVSLETVLQRDPQVMLFAAGPYVPTTVDSVLQRPGWGEVEAVSSGRVHPVDTNWVDRPGPRLVDALEAIAGFIQAVEAPQ